jgi:hypothetical protein
VRHFHFLLRLCSPSGCGCVMDFSKYEDKWTPVRAVRMDWDKKLLLSVLPRNRASSKTSGYITPPLNSPRAPGRISAKRIGVLALLLLVLLYLCGFSVPGYGNGNKKVVIILASNIGGGKFRAE